MERKLIGHAAVDSGQLIVVDPCYLADWQNGASEDMRSHYGQCCKQTLTETAGGEVVVSDKFGTGVAFATGYGDGCYPVYAHYKEGRIMKIEVDFE